jgi:uncharacterized iron-regulated membrane protein
MTEKHAQRTENTHQLSQTLRRWRRVHHYLGLSIAILLLISALTGLLLGWKKEAAILQPPTQRGEAKSLEAWRPLHELEALAAEALHQAEGSGFSVDRIDVRPERGIAKVLFKPGYWEVQIDGATGEVRSIARRYSDLIEQIHDGSIVSEAFKLVSMNVLGIGIGVLILSGLWLWYGPRKIRRSKRHRRQD